MQVDNFGFVMRCSIITDDLEAAHRKFIVPHQAFCARHSTGTGLSSFDLVKGNLNAITHKDNYVLTTLGKAHI